MNKTEKCKPKTNSLKIGNVRVNIHSTFTGEKKLEDSLFSMVMTELREIKENQGVKYDHET